MNQPLLEGRAVRMVKRRGKMKKGQKAKFSVKKNRRTGRYTKINKQTHRIISNTKAKPSKT